MNRGLARLSYLLRVFKELNFCVSGALGWERRCPRGNEESLEYQGSEGRIAHQDSGRLFFWETCG
jgi:hypothetical protein